MHVVFQHLSQWSNIQTAPYPISARVCRELSTHKYGYIDFKVINMECYIHFQYINKLRKYFYINKFLYSKALSHTSHKQL